MLVLNRKTNQKIKIRVPGREPIELTIVDINKKNVRVGIEADSNVLILRSELEEDQSSKSNGS